jgi:hypothetical protein
VSNKCSSVQILDIQLFILRDYVSENTNYGDIPSLLRDYERIKMAYKELNAKRLITSELIVRKGCTMISSKSHPMPRRKPVKANFKLQVCANSATASKIREIVRDKLEKDICLKELDFWLYMTGNSKTKQTSS